MNTLCSPDRVHVRAVPRQGAEAPSARPAVRRRGCVHGFLSQGRLGGRLGRWGTSTFSHYVYINPFTPLFHDSRSSRSLSIPFLSHTIPCHVPPPPWPSNRTSRPSSRGSFVFAYLIPSSSFLALSSSMHAPLHARCLCRQLTRGVHDRTRSGPRRRRFTRASGRTSSRSCRTCSARAGWRSTTTTRSRATTTRTLRTTPSRRWTCRCVLFSFALGC